MKAGIHMRIYLQTRVYVFTNWQVSYKRYSTVRDISW